MKIIRIEETDSTNTWLRERAENMEAMTMVAARRQTAGRGQRGNVWESEPGKNLTFSLLLKPHIKPSEQFAVSEAVSLGIVRFLARHGIDARIKWPNDIYAGDRKICGILIENSLMGDRIIRSIAGVGLNVNQMIFLGDAPNPVSMKMLTGLDYDVRSLTEEIGQILEEEMKGIVAPPGQEDKGEARRARYKSVLWRGDGKPYPYRDTSTGEEFMAVLENVEPTGHLLLRTEEEIRRYAFKEVEFIMLR